jgi:hypothetical protein
VKHIVYKFDDGHYDERDFDQRGSQILKRGDIISRRGMTWKIDKVEQEVSLNTIVQIPTYWIYLTRVVAN